MLARTSVSTTLNNGQFSTDVASWTDRDESGATSDHNGTHLRLVGNGTAYAIREQAITVSSGDANTEHAPRVVVVRGDDGTGACCVREARADDPRA